MGQRIVEDPVLRHRLAFEHRADEHGEQVLDIEMWVQPGGGVPPHLHPRIEERFEVVEGRLDLLSGRTWRTAGPGEAVVIPPGTRHAYRNRSEGVVHARCIARPPTCLEGFLTDAAALGQAGAVTRNGMPKSPTALLQAAVMLQAYGEDVVLGFPPLPPRPIQRLLIPPLARLGARRRYRAGAIGGAAAQD
jgi:mannose-6-phosphate isomerase-like protein (cupin superfamily)